jgi:FKBP-type peptidyl-prolyl cis-trans isomerase FklB
MNRKWLALVIMFLAAFAAKAQNQTATTPTPKASEQASMTDTEKLSYGIGTQAGKTYQYYKSQGMEINIEMIVKGLKDAYEGNKIQVSEEDLNSLLSGFQKELQLKQEEAMKKLADKNKDDGDKFMLANKVKEGVMVLPESGGIQYKILKAGDGPKPTDKDNVEVNYKGMLINGKEFDSSYQRKQTATIPVSKIIPGWKSVLLNMPVGSKWEVVIPPDQAYGVKGRAPSIEPNSTLIFEIELLGVKPEAEPKAEPKVQN